MPVALLFRPIRSHAVLEVRSAKFVAVIVLLDVAVSTLLLFDYLTIRLCSVRAVELEGEGFWLLRYTTKTTHL